MSDQEHDHLVRAVFGRSEEAVAHLRAFLPGEVLENLDLSRLDLVPTSFVDQHHRLSEVDLLFRIGAARRETFVYLLMEHQSSQQRFMALRLLSYLVAIWEWWKADHAEARNLPVILPLVLHHGSRPWTAPKVLSELLDADDELMERLRPLIPELRYWVTDLAAIEDREILDRTAAFAPLAALTVFLLKHGRDEGLPSLVPLVATPILRLLARPAGRDDLSLLINYLDRIREAPAMDEVIEALSRVGGDAVVELSKTRGYITREEGRALGRAEGLAEGRALGRAEGLAEGRAEARELGVRIGMQAGLRDSLRVFLTARFGAVPDRVVAAIEAAEPEVLRAWIAGAATASTAELAFEGPGSRG